MPAEASSLSLFVAAPDPTHADRALLRESDLAVASDGADHLDPIVHGAGCDECVTLFPRDDRCHRSALRLKYRVLSQLLRLRPGQRKIGSSTPRRLANDDTERALRLNVCK